MLIINQGRAASDLTVMSCLFPTNSVNHQLFAFKTFRVCMSLCQLLFFLEDKNIQVSFTVLDLELSALSLSIFASFFFFFCH